VSCNQKKLFDTKGFDAIVEFLTPISRDAVCHLMDIPDTPIQVWPGTERRFSDFSPSFILEVNKIKHRPVCFSFQKKFSLLQYTKSTKITKLN
jgi:hypothetical protein